MLRVSIERGSCVMVGSLPIAYDGENIVFSPKQKFPVRSGLELVFRIGQAKITMVVKSRSGVRFCRCQFIVVYASNGMPMEDNGASLIPINRA